MSNSDKPRKTYINKGRPLSERHKRAIREGLMRAKLRRELDPKAQEGPKCL